MIFVAVRSLQENAGICVMPAKGGDSRRQKAKSETIPAESAVVLVVHRHPEANIQKDSLFQNVATPERSAR